jgi:hypothetical protein
MTAAAANDLRELRVQLERERDRRAVAEEWSAFLLVTLRSYLEARDAYDCRPVALRHGGSADVSSSSTDDESTKGVAAETAEAAAENGRRVDGGVSGIPKLRRRYERGSASSGQPATDGKASLRSGELYSCSCSLS